jgi:cell division septation protein DedD
MVTVEELIGNLLLRQNCVIIPSFGGFVAKKVSAKIDFSSGKMFPPRKSLLFNKQLINNDGLLINELSQANRISYETASNEIQSKVGEWNKSISAGERIEIDRVGYIYTDEERNICFEQDRFFNLLLESFGMGKIQFIPEEKVIEREPAITANESPIIQLNPVETENEAGSEQQEENAAVVLPEISRGRNKVWKYIAAACILPIAFYSIWIPMKTDVLESGVLSIYDFNPFRVQNEARYERPSNVTDDIVLSLEKEATLEEKINSLPTEVSVYTYKYDDELYIPVALSNGTETNEKEANNNTTEAIEDHDSKFEANAMHYIVGCFGVKTNATNFVAKLRSEGLDAKIVDVKNGLHRVAAGSAISLEELYKIKSEVTALGHLGWILK